MVDGAAVVVVIVVMVVASEDGAGSVEEVGSSVIELDLSGSGVVSSTTTLRIEIVVVGAKVVVWTFSLAGSLFEDVADDSANIGPVVVVDVVVCIGAVVVVVVVGCGVSVVTEGCLSGSSFTVVVMSIGLTVVEASSEGSVEVEVSLEVSPLADGVKEVMSSPELSLIPFEAVVSFSCSLVA